MTADENNAAWLLRSLLFCCALAVASCAPLASQPGASPTAVPTPIATAGVPSGPAAPTANPTTVALTSSPTAPAAQSQATFSAVATPAAVPTSIPVGTFVVPAAPSEILAPKALAGAVYSQPDIAGEVRRFFESFYQARSLDRGGRMDVDAVRQQVDGAYADYTIPLFEQEALDVRQGKELEVHFTNLAVRLDEWRPAPDGLTGTALVTVARTRQEVRVGTNVAPQTASYQFRLQRRKSGTQDVAWVAMDFLNPATGRWVSEPIRTTNQNVAAELQRYFDDFYAARTLTPGGKFDVDKTSSLTQLSFRAYTVPLLLAQQQEADQGKLTSVIYTDIKVELVSYDPNATSEGGVATVKVTRTARVLRPKGAEAPATLTNTFKVRDLVNDSGQRYWLTVDFFQPQAQKWVSDIAGMAVAVPDTGHG